MRRPEFREFLPYPRVGKKLPGILSREEVSRLINASRNLFQRTLLMVLYGTGMRRAEVARLKLSHVDSQRMIIRVVEGKGRKDRDLPLSPALLETLRFGSGYCCNGFSSLLPTFGHRCHAAQISMPCYFNEFCA